MAKLTKKAEILDTLHSFMKKEAEVAQTNISGEPCKDTKVTSVSEGTEHTDKNKVGPEHLNAEQGYEQKPSKDGSEPLAGAKQAEASTVDKLASEILASIQTKLAEKAQTNISGKPGHDTKIESVSNETEHTDKNNVGPEHLNDEQKYEQKDSKDKAAPLAHPVHKKGEEENVKSASFNFGAQFCAALIKKANEIKNTQDKVAADEMYKEAGRRDCELMIAEAAAALQQNESSQAEQEKIAEAQGAAYFDELLKQAQIEAVLDENNALKAKLAEYTEIEKQAQAEWEKTASAEREAALAAKVANIVITALKSEPTPASAK